MYKCGTCDFCVAIKETAPYGTCAFFPGTKIVNTLKDTCSNHSEERKEEQELERQYYESKRRR